MYIAACTNTLLPAFVLAATAWGQVAVLTGQYDINRTAANLAETILTPSNVNTSQFGLLFSRAVDGYIYAQPLYIPGVIVPPSTTPVNVSYAFVNGRSHTKHSCGRIGHGAATTQTRTTIRCAYWNSVPGKLSTVGIFGALSSGQVSSPTARLCSYRLFCSRCDSSRWST
jgi:hypothetical protein